MTDDPHTFTRAGFFTMLALDHRGSFKEMMGDADSPLEKVISYKKDILSALGDLPSGVLLDAEYGLPALKESALSVPYLLALEKSGYEEKGDVRHTELLYTGDDLRERGAEGTKLLLYMKGDGSEGDEAQILVAQEALSGSRAAGLPLFLEIVIYGSDSHGERTLSAMKSLRNAGVVPAVWKLEFPGSEALCAEIATEARDIPWILLSRGVEFSAFAEQLRVACAHGARGFLAGRSLWQESLSLTGAERDVFLRGEIRERFDRLTEALTH